jgi:hypothetical protein
VFERGRLEPGQRIDVLGIVRRDPRRDERQQRDDDEQQRPENQRRMPPDPVPVRRREACLGRQHGQRGLERQRRSHGQYWMRGSKKR